MPTYSKVKPESIECQTYKCETYDCQKIISESDDEDLNHIELRLWGINKESQPVLLRIQDFPAFCMIKLPKLKNEYGEPVKWNKDSLSKLYQAICEKIEWSNNKSFEHNDDAIEYNFPDEDSFSLAMRRNFYYFDENRHPFARICFPNYRDMKNCVSRCKEVFIDRKKVELKFYEVDTVNTITKMFCAQNLTPCQRFTCEGEKISLKDKRRISVNGIKEYIIDYQTMKKSDSDWIAKPKVCSFDIEAFSPALRAFPNENRMSDIIFSISLVFNTYKEKDTKRKYCIAIGKYLKKELDKDVIVISVETEKQLLNEFVRILCAEDPSVMIGYNIFRFDYKYIYARFEKNGLNPDELVMGRLKNKPIGKLDGQDWSSSAYGKMNIQWIEMFGRISVDVYVYIMRDFKLVTYKLDDVAYEFLNRKKEDLKPYDMFCIFDKLLKLKKKIKNISIDKLEESYDFWDEDHEFTEISKNSIGIKKRCAAEDIIREAPKNLRKDLENAFSGNSKIIKYNVQDSDLVIDLFEKLNIWTSILETGAIVGLDPMDTFTRGQQVRCKNMIYAVTLKEGFVMTTRERVSMFSEGGKVEKPLKGFHKLVLVFDFASLYPSIIRSKNICFSTLVAPDMVGKLPRDEVNTFKIKQQRPVDWKPKSNDSAFDYADLYDKDKGEEVEDEERLNEDEDSGNESTTPLKKKKELKKKKGKKVKKEVKKIDEEHTFEFVKKKGNGTKNREGILGMIERELGDARKAAKKIMESYEEKSKNLDNCYKEILKRINGEKTYNIGSIPGLEKEDKILKDEGFNEEVNIEELSSRVSDYYIFVNIYDTKQKAIKVSMNSLYGFLGVSQGEFGLIEGSMSITYVGRTEITRVGNYLKEKYGAIIVYGDTDSVMVIIPSIGEDKQKAWEMMEEIGRDVNGYDEYIDKKGIKHPKHEGLFEKPMSLEAEKAIAIVNFEKKMYAYYEIDKKTGDYIKEKGKDIPKLKVKGLLSARRERSPWMIKFYTRCLRNALNGGTLQDMNRICIEEIIKIIELKFDITEELAIVKTIGEAYKLESNPIQKLKNLMDKLEKPLQVSERIKCIVVNDYNDTLNHKKLDDVKVGDKLRPIELFVESWQASGLEYGQSIEESKNWDEGVYDCPPNVLPPETIDVFYYINNGLDPMDKMFNCVFGKELAKYEDEGYDYKPDGPNSKRMGKVKATEPYKVMVQMLKAYSKDNDNTYDFSGAIEEIRQLEDFYDD